MIEVFSDSFHWKKTQGVKLIAKLVMGDLKCKKQVITNSNPVSVKRRLQTAHCRLQTGGKMQTVDSRPGVKCRLRIK